MTYRILGFLGLCASPLLWAAPASAAEVGGGLTLSVGATAVSDYRFRGISFSGEDPALQGSVELEHTSGFYVGAWASTLEDTPLYGEVEVDLYGGWRGEIASGTSVDVGILYYAYPDGDDGIGDSNYWEPHASISHTLGPVEATVGIAYAWDQGSLGGRDNVYLWGGLSGGIPGTPVTLNATLGHSDGSLAPTGEYWDWSLGAEAAFGPVTVGVAYVDTDLGNFANVDPGVVFSLGVAF